MKRALMVTSVASMIKQFNMPNIQILQDLGYEVTVATNFKEPGTIPIEDADKLREELKEMGIVAINVNFHRSPLSNENLQAYRQIKLIIDEGNFDLIHCHSPVGGALTRMAARDARKNGTKVIYTAHGFHFFKGGPVKNWLYYPIERFLSKHNNVLITINHEDYARAKHFKTTAVVNVPGVGVDTKKFSECQIDEQSMRAAAGIPADSLVILSVGELNDRKNHRVIIEAMHQIDDATIPYAICGQGENRAKLQELVDSYNLQDQVHFLGYRNDIAQLYKMADIFAFPSKREGLGLAGIEAMAAGLPIITSNINGINEYSVNGETGFTYAPDDIAGFREGILKLRDMDPDHLGKIKAHNVLKSREYDQEIVNGKMREVYSSQ